MRFNFKRRMLMLAGIGSWLGAFQAGAAEAVAAPAPAILILGDSLSAEYGLKRGSGWVALLTQRLQRERIAARVVAAYSQKDSHVSYLDYGSRTLYGVVSSELGPRTRLTTSYIVTMFVGGAIGSALGTAVYDWGGWGATCA